MRIGLQYHFRREASYSRTIFDGNEKAEDLRAQKARQPYEALYVTAVNTGLRQGELLGPRWDAVDLDAATLRVQRILQNGSFYLPKSGKGRSVRLTRQTADPLRAHRKRQLEERMQLAGLRKDHGLISPNRVGRGPSTTPTFISGTSRSSWNGPCSPSPSDCMTCVTRAPRSCSLATSTRKSSRRYRPRDDLADDGHLLPRAAGHTGRGGIRPRRGPIVAGHCQRGPG